MALHDHIRDYYFAHLEELSADKQFHFASRLAAWEQDERATVALERLKPQFVPDFPADGALRARLQDLITHPPATKLNAENTRAKYLASYPRLRGLDFAMFRVRHWLVVYDIDGRDAFFDTVSERELTNLERALLHDPAAMRALSTYAINFIYLLERVMFNQDGAHAINLKALYKLGKDYDYKSTEQLQLCIYFYTHCIIGDTNFYVQPVPDFALPLYKKMLKRLDTAIKDNYDRVNLDNKLEFLVCARICDYQTTLFERIEAECQQSLSKDGTFLVDRQNRHQQSNKTSRADSEHRNVLYIMSQTAYRHRADG